MSRSLHHRNERVNERVFCCLLKDCFLSRPVLDLAELDRFSQKNLGHKCPDRQPFVSARADQP